MNNELIFVINGKEQSVVKVGRGNELLMNVKHDTQLLSGLCGNQIDFGAGYDSKMILNIHCCQCPINI